MQVRKVIIWNCGTVSLPFENYIKELFTVSAALFVTVLQNLATQSFILPVKQHTNACTNLSCPCPSVLEDLADSLLWCTWACQYLLTLVNKAAGNHATYKWQDMQNDFLLLSVYTCILYICKLMRLHIGAYVILRKAKTCFPYFLRFDPLCCHFKNRILKDSQKAHLKGQ